MHIQIHPPCKFLFTKIAVEWFLSSVDTNVCLHIELCEASLVTDLTNKRFDPAVHHLEVFGETKSVDKTLPALLADMDPTIAVHPAVTFESLRIREALPTEGA